MIKGRGIIAAVSQCQRDFTRYEGGLLCILSVSAAANYVIASLTRSDPPFPLICIYSSSSPREISNYFACTGARARKPPPAPLSLSNTYNNTHVPVFIRYRTCKFRGNIPVITIITEAKGGLERRCKHGKFVVYFYLFFSSSGGTFLYLDENFFCYFQTYSYIARPFREYR